MADVSKIFKPRRGTKSVMAGTKKTTVLASGEMFVEVPDAGVGKGASKIKIGDGTTAYSSLPYALGDTSNDQITFSSNTSTTVAAALNSVTSGGSLKNIVAGLKQAISLCNTSITQLNDELTNTKNSFNIGCKNIVAALTAKGVTPTSNSIEDIITAINSMTVGGDVKHNLKVSVYLTDYAKYPYANVNVVDTSNNKTLCTLGALWTTDSSGGNTHSKGCNTGTQSKTFTI